MLFPLSTNYGLKGEKVKELHYAEDTISALYDANVRLAERLQCHTLPLCSCFDGGP